MVAGDTKPTGDEPKTFSNAWNHPNQESQRKWQEAIWGHEEATDMEKDA